MKCIKCSYPLWNLREPRCPECGEAFDVRDWQYNPKHVAFLCPHCQHKLGPYKPGPIDKDCPGCDHFIDWASVTVVPLIEDESHIARRKGIKRKPPVFAFGTLVIAIGLGLGGFCVFTPVLAGRPEPSPFILLLLGLIGGVALAWIGISTTDKKYRSMNIVIWVILVGVWSTYITQAHYSKAHEYEAFRWWADSSSALRQFHTALQIYLTENSPPPSIKLLAAENYFYPDLLLIEGSHTTLEDISIGSLTLQEFVDGDVTKEQLWLAAEQNPVRGEWEVVGDLVFSRRFDLYDKQDPKIIIGLCSIPSRVGNYSVLYADGRSEVLTLGTGWIAAQNKLRKSLGLEPLPDLP